MSDDLNPSQKSIMDATRSRARFSGHGDALGAAGKRQSSYDPENSEFLREPGHSVAISPGKDGFQEILIGVEWDNVQTQNAGFFEKLFKKARKVGVDLDLGCLYELQDGQRGCIQAFGDKFGALDTPPYIQLSGDERTGDQEGHDETILIKGEHWDKIKRLLIYIYIYEGAGRWSEINPKILVDIPEENDLVVSLNAHNDALQLCAVGGIENVRGGVKLTNYTEYFPGHMAMDRAYGFGLEWDDGFKE